MKLPRFLTALGKASKPDAAFREVATHGRGLLQGLMPGGRGTPPERDARALIASYKTHPWVRTDVGRIATDLASVEWTMHRPKRGSRLAQDPGAVKAIAKARGTARLKLVQEAVATGELEQLARHDVLDVLQRPTPFFFMGSTARRLIYVYRIMAGEAFEIVERRGKRGPKGVGVPAELWPIPPHWVLATPTPGAPFFRIGYKAYQQDVPMQDVYWHLQHPDPEDPYARGVGYGRAMGDELDADENAARLQSYAFYNRGRPDAFVSMVGADPEDVNAAQEFFEQKTRGVAKYLRWFFTNLDAKVTPMSQDFRELDLLKLRQFGKDTFREGLGIPPEIVGQLENSNRATIDAADYHYGKHVLVPELEFEREFRQATLVDEFEEGLVLGYVSPVAEDREFQAGIMKALPTYFTIDEVRAKAGLPPLPNGDGLGHVRAIGVQPIASLVPPEVEPSPVSGALTNAVVDIVGRVAAGEIPRDSGVGILVSVLAMEPAEAEAVMGSAGTKEPTQANPVEGKPDPPPMLPPGGAPPPPGQPKPPAPGQDGGEEDEEEEGRKSAALVVVRRALNTPEHWRGLATKLFAPGEEDFARAYRAYLRELQAEQVQRIEAATSTSEAEALLFPLAKWRRRCGETMRPVYRRIYDAAEASAALELQGPKSALAIVTKSRLTVTMQHLDAVIQATVNTKRDRLKRALERAIREGQDQAALRRAVLATFAAMDEAAGTIAVDQTSAAVNMAREDVFQEAGVEGGEWLTAEDELVREFHVAYGRAGVRPLDFNYATLVGAGHVIRYPHDPECAELGDVINCRCVLVPAVEAGRAASAAPVRRKVAPIPPGVRAPAPPRATDPEALDLGGLAGTARAFFMEVAKALQPVVHVHPTPVTVNIPPTLVNVPAPVVNVPAPVVNVPPAKARKEIRTPVYDAKGKVLRVDVTEVPDEGGA